MRRLALVFLVFLVPISAQAACLADGYTVVFINGIKTSETEAGLGKAALVRKLGDSFNGQPLSVILGYNESRWGGDGDVIEATLPQFAKHDLDTILMQIHDEVQTRKLLIVGHSQGAMFANRIYDYLITHGVPADAVAVYGIGTPGTILQHKGKY